MIVNQTERMNSMSKSFWSFGKKEIEFCAIMLAEKALSFELIIPPLFSQGPTRVKGGLAPSSLEK
jgi:hypothetical protein